MRYTCKAEQTKAEEEEENAHFQFHLNLYFRLPFVLGRIECEVLSMERYTCTTAVCTLCVCVSAFLKSDIEIKCEKWTDGIFFVRMIYHSLVA